MADPLPSALIVAAGAAVAGFAQGLTGFAFSVVALSFWAWALPPQTAALLAVFGALTGQIASLASVRGGFEWTRIIPLIVGGWLGVPLGVFLLHHADPQNFRLAVGVLLTLYSLFALFLRHPAVIQRGGRGLDAFFGLIGGVLGGLGGMSGFVPAIWTQDGDVEPLQRALESPRGNEFARSAALAALGYLVRAQGVLSDEDMRLYLRRLRLDAAPPEESEFWVTWAMTAADLGYGDLRIDVAVLMKDGLIDECDFDLDAFDRRVELVRDDPAGLAGFHGAGVLPLDDAVEVLDAWSSFSEDDFDRGENVFDSDTDSEDIAAPHVNPLRRIGRNDPCPCGSGKKYKKCCLGA